MRLKALLCTILVMAIPGPLVAAGADDSSAKFTVSEQTMIPGATLPPGSYSIRVLDHLQDRYIVRVDSAAGDTHSTFIGVQDPKLRSGSTSGVVAWGSAPAGSSALRGYAFGTSTVEFVYPKADAVALAKLNGSKVPAIDPASEGRPAELSGLSKDDMEIVSLWLLSSTRVGPNDTGEPQIKAEHFQQVAGAKPPKPVITQLPHTASLLPLTLLAGLFAFAGAAAIRSRRVLAQHSR